jgi:hypothetical protein
LLHLFIQTPVIIFMSSQYIAFGPVPFGILNNDFIEISSVQPHYHARHYITSFWLCLAHGGDSVMFCQCRTKGKPERHILSSREYKRVWENEPSHSQVLPLWDFEFQWTPEFLGNDYRGQNPLDWRVLYIIRKLLKCKCLKCVCMTHLGLKTQVMTKRKVGNQIDNLTPNY